MVIDEIMKIRYVGRGSELAVNGFVSILGSD